MRKFAFMFGAMLGECLLRHNDNLSNAFQSPQVSAAEGQKISALTLTCKTLETRNDLAFGLFGETPKVVEIWTLFRSRPTLNI